MVERRAISVDGIVQGVGFRPFVHGLASRLHLQGFVRNQTGNVRIEVEGECGSLDRFLSEITHHPPPLAQIDRVSWSPVSPRGDAQFRIDQSEIDPDGQVLISPDVATCAACLGTGRRRTAAANRRSASPGAWPSRISDAQDPRGSRHVATREREPR